MKKALILSAALLALAGCASSGPKSEEVGKAITDAEQAVAAANKTGFLWRDTEKFLTEAKEAQKEGKGDDALKLAKKAKKQADLAVAQAKANANPKPAYPKN